MPTIGARLGLGIGTMVTLCAAIGLVSYTQSRAVSDKVREITEVKEPVNTAVHAMENSLVEAAFATLGYLSTGDQGLLVALRHAQEDFAAAEQKYSIAAGERKDNGQVATLQKDFTDFCGLAGEQIELRDKQALTMASLLGHLSAVDGLLHENIVASVKSDDPLAYRRLQAALEMEVNVNAITTGLGNFLLTGEPRFESRLQNAEGEFKQYFELYRILLLSSAEKNWAAKLGLLSDKSLGIAWSVIDMQKQRLDKLAQFVGAYRTLVSTLNNRLELRTEKSLAQAEGDVLEAGTTANNRILLAVLICIVVGLWGGAITTRKITAPIRQLSAVMNAIAQGDRIRRVELASSDELQSLGEAFNLMTVKLEDAERQRSAGLKAYAQSVQRAQEEERGRISRELHDDLCQRLSGMKFKAEVLADEFPPANKKLSRGLRDFTHELDRTITEVQRISSNLRPSVLDDFGLVTALTMLCKDFGTRHGIRTEFLHDEAAPGPVDTHIEIALYRIAQEALSNTAKHAHASCATLHLTQEPPGLCLTVADDGRGFTEADAARARGSGHGFGLISMRERSELLGGTFAIEADPGKGTTITVNIPLGPGAHHEEDQNPDC